MSNFYFKLHNKLRYKFRGVCFFFALIYIHSGTALHITEEDTNPWFAYWKD